MDQKVAINMAYSRLVGTVGEFEFALNDRNDFKAASKNYGKVIKLLKKERDALRGIVNVHKSIVKKFKKIWTKERNKRKNWESPVRNKLEQVLLQHNIERASYHGGDLTGKNIINLFNNADAVFDMFYT